MKCKVVNLERRNDRLHSVTKQIHNFGIAEFEVFKAFEGGIKGFNKSMHFVLEGEKQVLVLEDDCTFEGRIKDVYEAMNQLPKEWDLLYLGANVKSPQMKFSSSLYRLTDAWTSHAILYNESGAKYCFENFDWQGDMIYDEWLRTHVQQELKCFIIAPMLAFQADGYSDIWKAQTTYGIKDSGKYLL